MIKFRLEALAKEKGLKHLNQALIKAGISPKLAYNYRHNKAESVIIEHLLIMCLLFRCNLHDLFEAEPDDTATADLTQLIWGLLKPKPELDTTAVLSNKTPDEIRKLLGGDEEKEKDGKE